MHNMPLFIVQLCNFTFLFLWFTLTVIALIQLVRSEPKIVMSAYLLWAVVIFCIPIIGAALFLIYRSKTQPEQI